MIRIEEGSSPVDKIIVMLLAAVFSFATIISFDMVIKVDMSSLERATIYFSIAYCAIFVYRAIKLSK